MSEDNIFDPSPFRPMLNIGSLVDIPTGRYFTGIHGESILNGGLSHLTGIGGRGNSFKSTILFFMLLRALARYAVATMHVYDTESTLTKERLLDFAMTIAEDLYEGILNEGISLSMTDKTVYDGTQWFDRLKEKAGQRWKMVKGTYGMTPFVDRKTQELIKYLYPFLIGIDSLSMFNAANVVKIQEENDIGESSRQTEALRDGGSKTQFIMELATFAPKNGIWMGMTAHMGDEFALDQQNLPQKKLHFLKNRVKFKNTPEKFTFLMGNCWYAHGAELLIHKELKTPRFPRDKDDDLKGDTDLQTINLTNLRGKSGMSGLPLKLVVSQTEGVLPSLSEFLYTFERNFGGTYSSTKYVLDLCPDINLSRTTIRGAIDESAKLRRALEITSEMCQIDELWTRFPKDLMCTPKELFDDLKAKGYDWDQLLNTRGYWLYDNDNHEVPFLSTLDLLHMRKDLYKPYWMT